MVLGPDREPLVPGVEARTARHRPALEPAVRLEPQVPVQPRRIVLLHHQHRRLLALAADRRGVGLGCAGKVPLRGIFGERIGRAIRHDQPALRLGDDLAAGFFVALRFAAGLASPALAALALTDFLSAAIRSMTLPPTGAAGSSSGVTRLPLFFILVSIRSRKAST